MVSAVAALVVGLFLLVWSANRFVEGSAAIARHAGVPTLLIGMLILGFGTSAPEMVVSGLAAWDGRTGIALGNAYGSNICNVGLILGFTALVKPIVVHSSILKKELPILVVVTALAAWQLLDRQLSRVDSAMLLIVFAGFIGWSILESRRRENDALANEVAEELADHPISAKAATISCFAGLVFLVASSRMLVWGAVEIAEHFQVSDLVIGLTIVAIGTSLPELASSLVAARKGEHDLVLGNILGSNLFNTLAVIGIAGLIMPSPVHEDLMQRDIPIMAAFTVSLFAICYGFKGQGRVNRFEGALLLAAFIAYTSYLVGAVAV